MTLTLEESARRAGANRWIEARLFEVTGGWVAGTAETEARLMLDRHSRHHAWRAEQWWARLPVLADVDRALLEVAPSPGWQDALDHLAGIESTVGRLGGLYRAVLPRLLTRYHRQHDEADDVSDGSSRRALAIVSADLSGDAREGEAVLQDLLDAGGAEAVGHAHGAAAAVESLLVG